MTPHRFAAGLALLVIGVWALLVALVAVQGALEDQASGRVAVVFPRGTAPEDMLAAVAQADGLVLSGTWFDNVLVAEGSSVGFVGRLKAGGALSAWRSWEVDYLALGGCFFGVTPARHRRFTSR